MFYSNEYSYSVNTIFECSYLFFGWEKAVHYVRTQMGESRRGGGDPKYVQVRGIRFKKQAFDFYKTNSYTNVCLKFLSDAKLITPLFIF